MGKDREAECAEVHAITNKHQWASEQQQYLAFAIQCTAINLVNKIIFTVFLYEPVSLLYN